MAFALVDATLCQTEIPNAVKKYGLQYIELKVTRTSSDTDCDIGDTAGTFWTDVTADATYGALAQRALDEWKKVAGKIRGVVSIEAVANNAPLIRAGSASSATNYALSNNGTYPLFEPVVTFNGSVNPATVTLILQLSLTDTTTPAEFTN